LARNPRKKGEIIVFEGTQPEAQSSSKSPWLILLLVAALVLGGALIYVMSKSNPRVPLTAANSSDSTSSTKPAVPAGKADPTHDIKVSGATMDKDRTGTTAVWLVTLENKSQSYTYSAIKYETSYMGADNNSILVNQGTITVSLAPGEQKKSEFRDALYPAGTAWFKIKVTGATASVE
jgi:hypothetical protein